MVATPVKKTFANFDASKFASDKVDYAYLQVLHKGNADKFGFFISEDQAELCEFTPDKSWKSFERQYDNGDTAKGYLCKTPKMVVLRSGTTGMYDTSDGGSKWVGFYDPTLYQMNKGSYSCKTPYLVFFVDSNYKLLNKKPVKYNASGMFGTKFSKEAVKPFRDSVSNAYKKAFNVSNRPTAEFLTLCVLELDLEFGALVSSEAANKKSNGTVLKGFTKITADNLAEYHVNPDGSNKETEDLILKAFEATKDFSKSKPKDEVAEEAPAPIEVTNWATAQQAELSVSSYYVKMLGVDSLSSYKDQLLEIFNNLSLNCKTPNDLQSCDIGHLQEIESNDQLIEQILQELKGE